MVGDVYVCVYMSYVCMHVCMYIYIYIYIYIYTYLTTAGARAIREASKMVGDGNFWYKPEVASRYVNVHTYMHTRINMRAHILAYIHAYIMHMYTPPVYSHIHVNAQTYVLLSLGMLACI